MRSFFAEVVRTIFDDDPTSTSPIRTNPATPIIHVMSGKPMSPPTFEEVGRILKSLNNDAQRFIYLAYLSRENLITPRHLFAHLRNDEQRSKYFVVEAKEALIAMEAHERRALESTIKIDDDKEHATIKAEHDRIVAQIQKKEAAVREQIASHFEERTKTILSETDGFNVLPTQNSQEPMAGIASLLSQEWEQRKQHHAEEVMQRITLKEQAHIDKEILEAGWVVDTTPV